MKALRQGLKPNDYLFSSSDAVLLQGHFTVLKKFSLFFLENPKIQLEKKSSVNWNLILSAETQSVQGLQPAHLPQNFSNKNQQGVLKLEEKTFVEVGKDLTIQQAMPVMDYAGVIVKEPALPTLEEIKLAELQALSSEETEETDYHLPLWAGLRLKLQQGLENAGRFYKETVSEIGEAIGVAEGEPFWNAYLSRWHIDVNFACGCKSVACDWVAIA